MPAYGPFLPETFLPSVRFLFLLSALFPVVRMQGQTQPAAKAASDDFHRTVQRSGLIFEGTVTAVQCEFVKGQPRTYRVSFQVKQGARGVASGAALTSRE